MEEMRFKGPGRHYCPAGRPWSVSYAAGIPGRPPPGSCTELKRPGQESQLAGLPACRPWEDGYCYSQRLLSSPPPTSHHWLLEPRFTGQIQFSGLVDDRVGYVARGEWVRLRPW